MVVCIVVRCKKPAESSESSGSSESSLESDIYELLELRTARTPLRRISSLSRLAMAGSKAGAGAAGRPRPAGARFTTQTRAGPISPGLVDAGSDESEESGSEGPGSSESGGSSSSSSSDGGYGKLESGSAEEITGPALQCGAPTLKKCPYEEKTETVDTCSAAVQDKQVCANSNTRFNFLIPNCSSLGCFRLF